MDALILNGMLETTEFTNGIETDLKDQLNQQNYDVNSYHLREMNIKPCRGCFGCWVRTPGECVIDDIGRDVAKSIINSNLLIYLTPVTFGGYSSELKKALDRSISLVSPFFTTINGETHHKTRYDEHPSVLVIGILNESNEKQEEIFTTLVKRNSINLHSPAHSICFILKNQTREEIQNKIKNKLMNVGGAQK